jgi:dTDP-4-dehydrorhamnose reductase
MNIAITGHCSGIGKSLNDLLTSQGHHVMGFDLKNGYDITNSDCRTQIVRLSVDADVFINNAYATQAQSDMLSEMLSAWHGQQKTIVNISAA